MHSLGKSRNYNIYSIKEIDRIVSKYGYNISKYEKFNIDVDIPKPSCTDSMGTYTKTFEGEKHRVQLSGPLLMP